MFCLANGNLAWMTGPSQGAPAGQHLRVVAKISVRGLERRGPRRCASLLHEGCCLRRFCAFISICGSCWMSYAVERGRRPEAGSRLDLDEVGLISRLRVCGWALGPGRHTGYPSSTSNKVQCKRLWLLLRYSILSSRHVARPSCWRCRRRQSSGQGLTEASGPARTGSANVNGERHKVVVSVQKKQRSEPF